MKEEDKQNYPDGLKIIFEKAIDEIEAPNFVMSFFKGEKVEITV